MGKIHCPAQTLTGNTLKNSIVREKLFQTETCVDIIKKRMKERTGIDGTLGGKCFVVCPYTQKYKQIVTE